MSRTINPTIAKLVPCPNCKTPTPYRVDNPYRPFCSERCKTRDFGAWATEAFRVQAEAPTDEDFENRPQTH